MTEGRPRCVPGGGEQVPRELPREGTARQGDRGSAVPPPARAHWEGSGGCAQLGAALSLGPRGGWDRKEGSVPDPRGAKRGRPSDPPGVESSHPELPECRRGEPKLPTGTRRISVAARPPPSWDGSLYESDLEWSLSATPGSICSELTFDIEKTPWFQLYVYE